MFDRLVRFAVDRRLLVVAASLILLIYGALSLSQLPIDVLPDFNRPVVTIFAEAHGLAPEEVETLVTRPIESAVNGATDVVRVRSASTTGLSLVFVEFDWDTDIFADRQVVSERLQTVASQLPPGVTPVMGPITSIMGSIALIGLQSPAGPTTPMELRSLADWMVRPRLEAIPGVSQVINLGGGVKQYQVQAIPSRLKRFGITLRQLEEALAAGNSNSSGGYLEVGVKEYQVRNLGRIKSLQDLENTIVSVAGETPVYVKDLARVVIDERVKRGDAGVDGEAGVITNVFMQPGANTVAVTEQLDEALDELQAALPEDVKVNRRIFRQVEFIESAVGNMKAALRDATILVLLVLPVFLLNFRTTLVTMISIPLSFLLLLLVMPWLGFTINTMTLGGLALAVGELVDDAIVGVENVYRRLRQNGLLQNPKPPLQVLCDATVEVREPILYSTYLVLLIFLPILFLTGVEARIFMPLGIAFILSIAASTVVAVLAVPAFSAYLLADAPFLRKPGESGVSARLKRWEATILEAVLPRSRAAFFVTSLAVLMAVSLIPFMGMEFMPPFNEGSFTVNVLAQPGTSLSESSRIGAMAEKMLLEVPEVQSTGRRTGRAELDAHAEQVYYTEIDTVLAPSERDMEEIAGEVREELALIPGVNVAVGQPISHKIDHLLSGISAQVAVKIFGPDLATLHRLGEQVREAMASVWGVVDLQLETQVPIPQLQIRVNRQAAGFYGLSVGEVNEHLETLLNGRVVSQVLEGEQSYDLVLQAHPAIRENPSSLSNLLIDLPSGAKIPLSEIAKVEIGEGPNQILRENSQRRLVVQCNVSGRDLGSTVDEIRARVAATVDPPPGYFILYGGQFESQTRATRTILITSAFVILGIFLLLFHRFRDLRIASLILVNLPLAVIGSIIAVFLTGGTLSIASLIGFIAVFSIASRTSLMLLSHYLHLMRNEGERFSKDLVIRGAVERVVPVLMTATTTSLGLIPLVLGAGETGKEILHPVAVILLGGVISSTFLVMIVVPLLFFRFGEPIWRAIQNETELSLEGR